MLGHNGMNRAIQRLQTMHPRTHFAALAPHVAAAMRNVLHIHTHWMMATYPFMSHVSFSHQLASETASTTQLVAVNAAASTGVDLGCVSGPRASFGVKPRELVKVLPGLSIMRVVTTTSTRICSTPKWSSLLCTCLNTTVADTRDTVALSRCGVCCKCFAEAVLR